MAAVRMRVQTSGSVVRDADEGPVGWPAPGEILDGISDEEAADLIGKGHAEAVEADEPEAAEPEAEVGPVETATAPDDAELR